MHRVLNDMDIYIVGAARTPMGKFDGILADVGATALGAAALKGALDKGNIPPSAVDEVFMGNVVTGGLGQAPAKQASVGAGIGHDVPATLVNSVCSSGISAIVAGVNAMLAGTAGVVAAGGMESRSMAAYLLGPKLPDGSRLHGKVHGDKFILRPKKNAKGYEDLIGQIGEAGIHEASIYDGLVCPFNATKLMRDYAEAYATKRGWTPELINSYADESHRKAAEAQAKGWLDDELIPVGSAAADELLSEERRIMMREWSGSVCTPYNCPGLGDNASAVVLASAERVEELGLKPLARLTGYARVECAPSEFVEAPVRAIEELRDALADAGLVTDWSVLEMNESFGMQLPLYQETWPDVEMNVHGGTVAFQHPLGSAGVRALVTLLYAMKRHGHKRAATAVCFGGGGACALALER